MAERREGERRGEQRGYNRTVGWDSGPHRTGHDRRAPDTEGEPDVLTTFEFEDGYLVGETVHDLPDTEGEDEQSIWRLATALTNLVEYNEEDPNAIRKAFVGFLTPWFARRRDRLLARLHSGQGKPVVRELLCELCGRDYPIWYADNELWNAVMRPAGEEEHAFVCLTCFALQSAFLGIETVLRVSRGD